jgi:3-isopropylmalate/(R)-2-methylmalate dehydratase small subunit
MIPIQKIEGTCVPLPIRDIDTDMIIPAQYMTSISQQGYGKYLFDRLKQDPQFPLNLDCYNGASIIIAKDNFGCGSSREHAVWALMDAGYRAILSTSFADIFKTNSGKNGLLTIELPDQIIESLLAEASGGNLQLEIDLLQQTVCVGEREVGNFTYDPFVRYCLLQGLDDLEYLLKHKDYIDKYFLEHSDTLVDVTKA